MTSRPRSDATYWLASLLLVNAMGQCRPATAAVGEIDPSFGDHGALRATSDPDGFAWSVLPDGRVLKAFVADGIVHLLRFDRDGHTDPSFGSVGELTLPTPGKAKWVQRLAPARDGSVYVAVYFDTEASTVAVGRVTSRGVPDVRFGLNGWLSYSAGAVAHSTAVVVDAMADLSDGGVAFVLDYWDASCGIQQVTQLLHQDGSVRQSRPFHTTVSGGSASLCYEFDPVELKQLSNGMLRVASGGAVYLIEVDGPTVTPDFLHLPGGSYYDYSSNFPMKVEPGVDGVFDFVLRESPGLSGVELIRLRLDGSVDPTFGQGGVAGVDFRSIVPALKSGDSGYFGSPMFFSNGFVWAGPGPDHFIHITVDAHEAGGVGADSVLVARLTEDGRLDESFGANGFQRIPGLQTSTGVAGESSDGAVLMVLDAPDGDEEVIIRLQGSGAATPGLIASIGREGDLIEGESLKVYVSRSLGSLGAVSVGFRTIAGTATAGSDFTSTSGTLQWADGETGAKQIEIPILSDQIMEGEEEFLLALENASGGVTLLNPTLHVRVHDPLVASGPVTPAVTTPGSTIDARGGGGSSGWWSLAALLSGLLGRSLRSRLCPGARMPA